MVYVNGRELFRSNMPAGAIRTNTLAASAVAGADETAWITAALSSGALVGGANLLAVEVHQASPGSSDLGLDLQLAATLEPRLVIAHRGADLVLSYGSADAVRVRDFYLDGSAPGRGVEQIRFANGTVWQRAGLRAAGPLPANQPPVARRVTTTPIRSVSPAPASVTTAGSLPGGCGPSTQVRDA